MVFRTIESSVSKSGKALKLFSKQVIDIQRDFSKGVGIGNKIKSGSSGLFSGGISTSDFALLKKYNDEIKRGIPPSTAYKNNLLNVGSATKKASVEIAKGKTSIDDVSTSLKATSLSAKVAEISMKTLSIVMNVGLMLAVSAVTTVVYKLISAQKDARKAAVELANTYKDEKDSLSDLKSQYQDLYEQLHKGNLSHEEERSIKAQLLTIQDQLVEKYGAEAQGINLVNGELQTQLNLLGQLSKADAQDFVSKTRNDYDKSKQKLEKERTYNVGSALSYISVGEQPKLSTEQEKLLEFLKSYNGIDLTYDTKSAGEYGATEVYVKVNADVEEAENTLKNFSIDVEKFGKENNIDVSGLLSQTSKTYKNLWTDELKDSKQIYDEFITANVMRSDELRPMYSAAIQAIEEYNQALQSGDNSKITETQNSLEKVQSEVSKLTPGVEDSQEVFDKLYSQIDKTAEASYKLTEAFSSDNELKALAEQLKGLSDIDLKSGSVEAFEELKSKTGQYKTSVEDLIDVLIKLGYVQGEVNSGLVESSANTSKSTSEVITSFADLESKITSVSSAIKEFEDSGRISASSLKGLSEAFGELSGFNDFIGVLSNSSSTIGDVQSSLENLVSEYITTSDAIKDVNSDTVDLIATLLRSVGVTNAEEVANAALSRALAETSAQKIIAATTGFDQMTAVEIELLIQESGASEYAGQMINYLALQKALSNSSNMTNVTAAEAENMLVLAQNAGIAGDVIAQMARKLDLLKQIEAGTAEANSANLRILEQEITATAPDLNLKVNVDTSSLPGAAKETKNAADEIKKQFEEELAAIKETYEQAKSIHSDYYNEIAVIRDQEEIQAGIQAQSEYFDALVELRDRYFEQGTTDWEQFNRQISEDMIKAAQDAVSQVSSELDNLQSVYDNLGKAVEEWDVNKHISVDTFQTIMSLGPQYLSYLADENGMLNFNKQAVESVMAAKIDELAVERALQLVQQISVLQKNNDIAALYALANANQIAAGSMWGFVNAQLASLNLQPQLLAAFQKQINMMQMLSKNAQKSIGKVTLSRKDYDQQQKKASDEARKAQEKAYDNRIKQLEAEKKARNKYYDEQIKRENDLLDAARKRIDAQIELLRRTEEQHDYNRELEDKQKEITDLENSRLELINDDSIEGEKRRLEIEEELAEKRKELEEFQHDWGVDQAEQGLEDELDRLEELHQAKIDQLNAQKDAENDRLEAAIEAIRAEKDAYSDMMQDRFDSQDREMSGIGAIHEAEQTGLDADMLKYQDNMSKKELLQQEAMRLVSENLNMTDAESAALYQKLLEWNKLYGTGVDEDVNAAWLNAKNSMQLYGAEQNTVQSSMGTMSAQMSQFESSTSHAASAMSNLAETIERATSAQRELNTAQNNFIGPKTYEQIKAEYDEMKRTGNWIKWPKNHSGNPNVGGKQSKGENLDDFNELYEAISGEKLKSNEIPTILEKGEAVIAKEDKSNWVNTYAQLSRDINNYTQLPRNINNYTQLPKDMSGTFLSSQFQNMTDFSKMPTYSSVMNNEPSISINMGGLIVQGNVDESTVRSFQKSENKIAEMVVQKIIKQGLNRGIVRNASNFLI